MAGFLKSRPVSQASTGLVSDGAVRRHLASAGRAVPQLHQRVDNRPSQLPNSFAGENRSRASEPVNANIQDGQRLLQLRDLELNGWVFSSSFGDSPARLSAADRLSTARPPHVAPRCKESRVLTQPGPKPEMHLGLA